MATRYAVETVFKIIDQFTNPLKSVAKEGSAIGNLMKNDLHTAEKSLEAIPGKLVDMGKSALKWGVTGVAAGIAVATKQFIQFDDAVTAAGAKFKDLDVTSENYQEHLAALGAEARRVASITPFSAVDTAGALDKMAMAGIESSQAMSLLEGTTSLAIATGIDLTSAVDMATDAMGAFNMMKDEFGKPLKDEALAASLGHLSDVVAKTTNMANTDMSMWFEAVKSGAPTFTSLGGTLEDFSAMVGVLANSGIKGGEAGTAIRNMMLNLSAPTKTASEALGKLGISAYDSAGNMLPILDIMKQFEDVFGDTTGLEAYQKALAEAGGNIDAVNISDFVSIDQGTMIQSLEAIFGKRTIGDFLILLNEGTAGIENFSKQLHDSENAAKNMANAMQQSLSGQLKSLASAATELGFKFVEAFKTQGAEGITKLTAAIQSFDPTTLINGLLAVANIVSGFVTMLINMRGVIIPLIAAFGLYKTVIMAVAIGMKAVEIATAAYQVVTGIATGIQLAHNAALWGTTAAIEGNTIAAAAGRIGMAAYSVATNAAAVAQNILNAAFVASPIGWIILAIGALVGLIVLLTKNWETWGQTATGVLEIIVPPLGIVIALVHGLIENWNNIVQAFKDEGIIAGLKAIGDTIIQAINAPIDAILEKIANIPILGTLITGLVDLVRESIASAVGEITAIFSAIMNGWNMLVSAFQAGGLVGVLRQIGGAIVSFLLAPIEKLMAGLTWIPGVGGKIAEWQSSLASFRSEISGGGEVVSNAPITARDAQSIQTERYFSQSESNSNVTIGLERGLTAQVSGSAPGVRINQYHSGKF